MTITTNELAPIKYDALHNIDTDENLLALYDLFRTHFFQTIRGGKQLSSERKQSYEEIIRESVETALSAITKDNFFLKSTWQNDENDDESLLVHGADLSISLQNGATVKDLFDNFYTTILERYPRYKRTETDTLERKITFSTSGCDISFIETIDHNSQDEQIARYFELSVIHTDGRTFQFIIDYNKECDLNCAYSCLIHIPRNEENEQEVEFGIFDVPYADLKRHEYAFLHYYLSIARRHIQLKRR